MKYKAYPEYKESGIEWIGKIPEGWEIKKLRFLGELDSSGVDKKIRDDELLYKSIHYMDVYRNRLSEIGNSDDYLVISTDENKAEKCLLKKGDVLFTNSSETPDDIGQSTVIKEDLEDTLFGYHLMRFRPKYFLHLQYQKYLFGSDLLRSWFELRANGITRYGINYVDFADALVMLPPLPDQTAIAGFLNRETTKIASVINAKTKLIEKLKEKRNAIISHAVTKGLDPNAKMKPSGIEWIGDIPEEWEVKKLKYICSVNDESLSETTYSDFFMRYVDIGSVTFENGIMDYQELIFENSPSRARRVVKHGDVIVSTVRTYLKAIAKIDDDTHVIVSTGFAVIRPKKLNENYLSYVIRTPYFVEKVSANSVGVSYPAINACEMMNIATTLPTLDQQTAIANYLDTETARIDAIIAKTEISIKKLKEYQMALISAAVTGKIDVRREVL